MGAARLQIKLAKFALKADNPLADGFNKWIAFVITSALLLQAYISPFFNSLLAPGGAFVPVTENGSSFFTLFLSTTAFLVSAGVVYAGWVKTLLHIYKKHLWYRFFRRYCIMGVWDAGFAFQANSDSGDSDQPTGYVRFEQDYLGRVEAALFYLYDDEVGQYMSESSMTGYLTGNTDKPCFRIFFKTRHFGGAKFASVADIADGIEVVEATVFSDKNGYPIRLFGDFSFYRRSKEQELWGGHTLYTRKGDMSIAHEIDDGYAN